MGVRPTGFRLADVVSSLCPIPAPISLIWSRDKKTHVFILNHDGSARSLSLSFAGKSYVLIS
jgi:hypothetical protein